MQRLSASAGQAVPVVPAVLPVGKRMPLSRGGGGGQRGPPRKFKRQGRQAQAAAPAPGSQLEVAGVEGLEEKAADLSIVEEVSVQPEEVGAAASERARGSPLGGAGPGPQAAACEEESAARLARMMAAQLSLGATGAGTASGQAGLGSESEAAEAAGDAKGAAAATASAARARGSPPPVAR